MLNDDNLDNMDVNLLLSFINMKLRNDFTSLHDLVRYYDIKQQSLTKTLERGGFSYSDAFNQFK